MKKDTPKDKPTASASAVEAAEAAAAAAAAPPAISPTLPLFDLHSSGEDYPNKMVIPSTRKRYIEITRKMAETYLEDEQMVMKDSIEEIGDEIVWKVEKYLRYCVVTLESILRRCEVIKKAGYNATDILRIVDRIVISVVISIEETTDLDIPVDVPWWEETFCSSKGFEAAGDMVLLAALAYDCTLTAAKFDNDTMFNARTVEEVYGMWVPLRSESVRMFVESMPSFQDIVFDKNVQSHWHCCYTNRWTGAMASSLLLHECHHPINDPEVTMGFYFKLCLEDIERTVQTRDSKLMELVLERIKEFVQWYADFQDGKYGVCCLFKAMTCCIFMTTVPFNPHIADHENTDDMFNALLNAIETMCPVLLSQAKYAYPILVEAVFYHRYDYALKLLKQIRTVASDQFHLSGIMLTVKHAHGDIENMLGTDPAVMFIHTLIELHPEIVVDIRNDPDYGETMEFVLQTAGRPPP